VTVYRPIFEVRGFAGEAGRASAPDDRIYPTDRAAGQPAGWSGEASARWWISPARFGTREK